MDKNRFDGFARQLAQRENRRQAIKTLLAGGVGTAAVVLGADATDAKDKVKPGKPDCCPTDRPRLCDFTCTDTSSDEANCGSCGAVCQSYQTCVNGVCTGTAPECSSPQDCPKNTNECQEAACNAGDCGFTNLPEGSFVMAQTLGDCKENVCDGNGGVTTRPANDPPQDNGECFTWVCNNDTPEKLFEIPGTACTGGTCNADGVCIQCVIDSDCPAPDNECKIRVCDAGTCGFDFVAAGTSCDGGVCDGAGTCVECVSPFNCDEPANGQATCDANTCGFDCDDGFGNCDGSAATGCETIILTDPNNCGDCGRVCVAINSTPVCIAGQCGFGPCNSGFADCDGLVSTGCETNLGNNVINCGACGNECVVANGQAVCINGTCQVGACDFGFANCNGLVSDGCEVFLSGDSNNCGACGNVCELPHTSLALCSGGVCQVIGCDNGWRNCDGIPATGCETNVFDDSDNCGTCGHVCEGSTRCRTGSCG